MTITVVLAEDQLMVLGALSTLLGLEADITTTHRRLTNRHGHL